MHEYSISSDAEKTKLSDLLNGISKLLKDSGGILSIDLEKKSLFVGIDENYIEIRAVDIGEIDFADFGIEGSFLSWNTLEKLQEG